MSGTGARPGTARPALLVVDMQRGMAAAGRRNNPAAEFQPALAQLAALPG